MKKLKISGKELRAIGYPEGPVISLAMKIAEKQFKPRQKEEAFDALKKLLASPVDFIYDSVFAVVATQLIPKPGARGSQISMNQQGIHFNIFGNEHIEQGALDQMSQAAKLPIAVAGALMPDAHHGYGLPIGGVLAVENAIIPYGVGVDIGCRMCLSVFDIDPGELIQRETFFARELNAATLFGGGKQFDTSIPHEVIDRKEFHEISFLRPLQARAAKQLGSSGSGNHFVEFGIVEIESADEVLGILPGKYLGLLSHSGSRSLGATIANHYTKIAKENRRLPAEAVNLSWFGLDEENGIEYWMAMNLAGDYASACHHIIHEKIAKQLGRQPIKMVENHHNFAWKETLSDNSAIDSKGKDVIVHRKGATPAGKNVLGIIPGSMTAPGFIVKGKGETASINSASHGAGRRLSRTAALGTLTYQLLNDELKKHGVKLMGGGLDEAPFAYKDIGMVMQSQKALVDIVGKFIPKIVKMDASSPKPWQKTK